MLTYLAAVLVLVAMPGPDQALITRNSLAGGRSGGLFTTFGGAAGLTVHAGSAAVGLSALLLASAEAFTVVKLVGVAYLVWIAVQTLRAAARSRRQSTDNQAVAESRRSLLFFRDGFLSSSLNPKLALFFVSFMPQFMAAEGPAPWLQAVALSGIFAAVYLGWFSLYVWGVGHLGQWLARPAVKSWIERFTGVALMGLAALLATAGAH
ncbi:MAG TPA: LysE family translocator [Nocardioidaceae bacterium]|nr:LysE family translocator [Nocardioidaceae bacterium]